MKISELKSAIREMIISELTVVDKDTTPAEVKNENPATVKAAIMKAKEMNKPVTIAEDDALNEMAFLKGPKAPEGLEDAITAVVKANSDAELADIRKAVKTDEKVISALKKVGIDKVLDGIADNQLNKFIELLRGNREVSPRGRKADPNKPAKEPKEKKEKGAKDSKKSNDTLAYTMGGDVKISGKTPTKSLIKKAVKAASLSKPIELLKTRDIDAIENEIVDLGGELKSKVAKAKEIATKGNIKSYTEEEATFMDDIRAKGQRLAQLKATKEKLLTKTIKRQDRNIDIASTDED